MEGAARRGRSRQRAGGSAQATLEFAFSVPLLLLCLFATVDAATWAIQTSAAVAAVEEGARLAASAPGTPVAEQPPTAAQVTGGVIAQLKPALFATSIRPWCAGAACASAGCPSTPAQVEAAFGPRVVAVCVHENAPPRCSAAATAASEAAPPYCDDPPTVTVRAVGFLASLVPPSFGLGWPSGEIPISVGATTHTLRFTP